MIKKFNQYLNESGVTLTQDQKDWLDKCTKGTWSVNLSSGLVDVDKDFDCRYLELENLMGVRFGRVSGSFNCSGNQLTSLEGAPQEVGEIFSCYRNKLTSLGGAPHRVGGEFNCHHNNLTSLKGAPSEVGGNFDCSRNKLTSLNGAPQEVGLGFYCEDNQLTSLEGAPQEVEGNFSCEHNQLSSLEGIPFVSGNFYLDPNPIWNLISPYWKQIKGMETGSINLVLKMIGQLETPKEEDITRIMRSVERMNMI
jgi:hypothetical protein